MSLLNITDNGVYPVSTESATSLSLQAAGTFGGATVEVGYMSDGVFNIAQQTEATQVVPFSLGYALGANVLGAVRVTGGTGIDIALTFGRGS